MYTSISSRGSTVSPDSAVLTYPAVDNRMIASVSSRSTTVDQMPSSGGEKWMENDEFSVGYGQRGGTYDTTLGVPYNAGISQFQDSLD